VLLVQKLLVFSLRAKVGSHNMISLFRKRKAPVLMENIQHLSLTQTAVLSRQSLSSFHHTTSSCLIFEESRKSPHETTLLVSGSPYKNKLKEEIQHSHNESREQKGMKWIFTSLGCQQDSN
jgi:hypothetical protein